MNTAIDRAMTPRAFRCRCGRPVFFGNTVCLACGTPLGYDPEAARLVPLQPDGALWRAVQDSSHTYRRCANFEAPPKCDWLVPADDSNPLCRACRLNRTIPNLGDEDNRRWWARIEFAKRRLVSSLISLRLPVRSRVSEDTAAGLAFDLLRTPPGAPTVSTGHQNGIITIDVEEADDARREHRRVRLDEPYRTLLGHLRHEVGHYYWQRLVDGTRWHAPFRELFGDERQDYGAAVARHHRDGPSAGWPLEHVSAYASAHPWEDWAETWAHYLHMVDTLATASSYGVQVAHLDGRYEPFGATALYDPDTPDASAFLAVVNRWIELTSALTELSRSMGQPDFYPFVLPARAVRKLHFVHCVVARSAE